MKFIGIDPSQRGTGFCILNAAGEYEDSHTIETTGLTIIPSLAKIRQQISDLVAVNRDACYGMERMLPTARNGALLFTVQVCILEILNTLSNQNLAMPLPIQLRSYMVKRAGFVPTNKSATVLAFREATGQKAVSSHEADAYFLARLARDVSLGKFSYAAPSVELPLLPWGFKYGNR